MERFAKIVITLLANVGVGRYKLRYHLSDIVSESDKTLSVQREGKPINRQQKKDMLKIKSDFRNETIGKLQFYTTCYEKDLKTAERLLVTTLQDKADELSAMNTIALQALKQGCKLEKLD
jgi:hypothetical protein